MDKDYLYAAALVGDADAIAKLEMEADTVDEDGETILHLESRNGNTKRVRFILRQFSHKNLLVKSSIYKHTALHLAIYEGHTQVAEVLINAATHLPVTSFQALVRQGDKDMDTALHAAVVGSNVDIVKLLVEADPSDTHIQNNEGKTPMYIAVEKGFNDIAGVISTTCTAPSLDGPHGSTVVRIKNLDQDKSPGGPLYKIMHRYDFIVAAIGGDADAIAKLEMQADILNRGEETILHVESQNTYAERVGFILREFAKKNILRQADKDLNTALHRAVMEGHPSIVKLLVEADPSDTNIQNKEGKTPMYIAVEKGLSDIVEIISTTCTTPSLDGPDGSTVVRIKNLDQAKSPGGTLYKIMDKDALYAAAIAGDVDADAIAKLEMEADRVNKDGETILHVESRNGNTERVRFILREFAHKNLLVKLSKYKHTALHLAVYYRHTEVAKALIDAARHLPVTSFQAFLRQGDKDMDTALHAAVLRGKVDIVKLLVEADPSDTHIQNDEGKTPMYIAVVKRYKDIVEIISATCTAPSLDGPHGSTALHAAILNVYEGMEYPLLSSLAGRQKDRDVIMIIINAAKRWSTSTEDAPDESFEALFNRTDESGLTVLEFALNYNCVNAVEIILQEDPAYQLGHGSKKLGRLMHLIFEAIDNDRYSDHIIEILSKTFEAGINPDHKGVLDLILAIRRRDIASILDLLQGENKQLVNFADHEGWTPLHYAAYHEFDSMLDVIIETQKNAGHQFVYEDMVPTPFELAAEKGYTSTVIQLMKLWPTSSCAYTSINKNGQTMLHFAAIHNKKEMIQGILKYCPKQHLDKFLSQQDENGNTPLHLLISNGCFIPELIKYKGLDTLIKNKENWTPLDMLYFQKDIIRDQALIKIALEDEQTNQKADILKSLVLPSQRKAKDVEFDKYAELLMAEEQVRMKQDLERYKRTHSVAHWFGDAIAGDASAKAALEMEADILNEEGETILHVESKKGDAERVRYIVREFTKKNLLGKLDRLKQTALHLAARYGHHEVAEVLIDAARRHLTTSSANCDDPISSFYAFIRQAAAQKRNTALHEAVNRGNLAIVKLLLEADPSDRHIRNDEGKTPIYMAAENGYKGIIKEICTTCTAQSLDGPRGKTTALHALIKNIKQEGASDVIMMMLNAAKHWSTEDASIVNFEALFSKTDESGSTVLQLAMQRNYVEAAKLILQEDPAYQHGREIKRNGLMRLIYEAIDNKYNDEMINLLSETYEAGINPDHKDVLALILSIKRRDEDSLLSLLGVSKNLVTFTEDNGWTPLHYAVYHEFDSIVGAIIEAQEEVGHQFVYENMVSTPFHVAIKYGYTSTLVRLMQLWPDSFSASMAGNSPYTVVDKDGRNILHLAAATDNRKEMVQAILKYCPEKYKDEILKQQDTSGDTPLHLLIAHGCFIPELIKHKGLDTMAKNNNNFTPRDMLYFKNDVVGEQVLIKIALDDVQTNQSAWNCWAKSREKKTDIWRSIVPPSKRRIKDVIIDEQKKMLREGKHEQMKKDLERYKMRTNTQIIVTALITTVTFTVGFTMPGGLRQSGEVDEGLVLLSKKTAFNLFMVSDALALLLSTSSLFFYFLESMNEDPRQVSKLNAASTVLNMVSVMAMMLTFIAGTYVVLSHSPAIAITVCVIGSLFFLLIIVLLIKIVYNRQKKRNED